MLDYPQVALDFMNRDHAEFVAMRSQLLDLVSARAPEKDLDTLLDELLRHTRHHFAEEERLMQETRFPPYAMHKSEHDHVLADMSARIASWKRERDATALRDWLDKAVGNWFVTHVGTMDLVTAGYIEKKLQTN
ncbi:MAG: hemerythrin family protein [Nitrosomonadales bacterium]|nr:hemerythrin family protein [Nitrosomonadales bacterium]